MSHSGQKSPEEPQDKSVMPRHWRLLREILLQSKLQTRASLQTVQPGNRHAEGWEAGVMRTYDFAIQTMDKLEAGYFD